MLIIDKEIAGLFEKTIKKLYGDKELKPVDELKTYRNLSKGNSPGNS